MSDLMGMRKIDELEWDNFDYVVAARILELCREDSDFDRITPLPVTDEYGYHPERDDS